MKERYGTVKSKYFLIMKTGNLYEIFVPDKFNSYREALQERDKIKKNYNIDLYILEI